MKNLKVLVLFFIFIWLVSCLAFAQIPDPQPRVDHSQPSQEEKDLLSKTEQEGPYEEIKLSRVDSASIIKSNFVKREIFECYFKKSSKIIKVYQKMQVGIEGQYTRTFFTMDSGKARIVEAYYGHIDGGLVAVKEYMPAEIQMGYIDWKDTSGVIHLLLSSHYRRGHDHRTSTGLLDILYIGFFIPGDNQLKLF